MGAAQPQEVPLEGILRQQTIRETFLPHLVRRELGNLSRVSHSIHEAVEQAISTAMEKTAIWESHVLNARKLDLHGHRNNYHDNQAFKDHVIRRIKRFAKHHPGAWIRLDLQENSLGNDLDFLRDLLQTIVTTVHYLKIDLAALDLGGNQLSILPERFFEDLDNLQSLGLENNHLTDLPERLFEGLNNLQGLSLYCNRLTTLPECIFKGLNNLERLELFSTQLESLPERLFEGLHNLQTLTLYGNPLASLSERLFKGLKHLQILWLYGNQLESLPARLFEGLDNLRELWLYNNRLSNLPERLFDGLSNLGRLYLSGNQLTNLPEHLFDGLNNLSLLRLNKNQLNEESICLLQDLRKREVDAAW